MSAAVGWAVAAALAPGDGAGGLAVTAPDLLAAVPAVPLLAALVIAVAGRALPRGGAWLAVAAAAVSLACLALLGGVGARVGIPWLAVGDLRLDLALELTPLSRFVAWVVAGVALPVSLYAVRYVGAAEPPSAGLERRVGRPPDDRVRFFATLSLFIGAMLALVLAGTLVTLFAAWEMVGVASYLLIAHRYTDAEPRRAALRAFLATRAADLGLLAAWLIVWLRQGDTAIGPWLAVVGDASVSDAWPPGLATLLAGLVLVAAAGKSAQLPLAAWLPAAMSAPTPVSALLHSATMVAAGAFLVLRLFPLFVAAPWGLAMLAAVGAASALTAAVAATAQMDLKRVLAWSTVSQLGEMFVAAGLAGPLAAAFHLAAHAGFKSTLFLAAGELDQCAGSRRLDELGGLARRMPRTAIAFAVGALALAGVPPLAGFWSEDEILGHAVEHGPAWGAFAVLLLLLAGLYVGRAGCAAFGRWPGAGGARGTGPGVAEGAADCGPLMDGPMLALAGVSVLLGVALVPALAQLLRFPEGPRPPAGWRAAAIVAPLVGLAIARAAVRRRGPVPLLPGGLALDRGLDRLLDAPAALALPLARGVARADGALDRAARGLAATVAGPWSLAAAAAGGDRRLDRFARSAAGTARDLADLTDHAETRGLAAAVDGLAHGLSRAGGRLRGLQSGELWRYTLGLFLWSLAALLAALTLWS